MCQAVLQLFAAEPSTTGINLNMAGVGAHL